MRGPSRNLEIKVCVETAEYVAIASRLDQLVCQPLVTMIQVDRYYEVAQGRLKLREIGDSGSGISRAELIAYRRPMEHGSRWSDYVVAPVTLSSIEALREALAATHTDAGTVEKDRTVGIIGNTRVHLDTVHGVGQFVELETVIAGQSEAAARAEHEQVIATLGLDTSRAIAGSYQDMIWSNAKPAP